MTKYTQSSNQKKHSQKLTFWARSWFNVAPLRPIKRIARRSLVQGIRRNQNTPLLNYLPKLSNKGTVGDLIKCKPANGHLQAVVNESPPWWEMSTRPPQQKWWGSGLSCFVWAWRNPVTQPSPGPISSACVASHVDRKARWKKWTLEGNAFGHNTSWHFCLEPGLSFDHELSWIQKKVSLQGLCLNGKQGLTSCHNVMHCLRWVGMTEDLAAYAKSGMVLSCRHRIHMVHLQVLVRVSVSPLCVRFWWCFSPSIPSLFHAVKGPRSEGLQVVS